MVMIVRVPLSVSPSFLINIRLLQDLLRSNVMTAGDLSAVTKPFPAQRHVAELVYRYVPQNMQFFHPLVTKFHPCDFLVSSLIKEIWNVLWEHALKTFKI